MNGRISPIWVSLLSMEYSRFLAFRMFQGCHSSIVSAEALRLAANQFHGHLPSGLSTCKHLEWLQMDRNQLTGTIPGEYGHMKRLHTIKFGHNQLSGSLPESLGDLHLVHLSVHDNKLSGKVPTAMGKLSILEDMHIQTNDMSGTMPKEICALFEDSGKLENLSADCDEPKIECSCCTACFWNQRGEIDLIGFWLTCFWEQQHLKYSKHLPNR